MTTPIVPSRIRTVYEGRVFTVQVESITLPKGHALDAEIVRHPGSVVIVPMTASHDVILVRQYRHAIGRYTWELPAGSLKPGEDVAAAARRECQEEIGMVAERLEALGSFFPTPGYCDEAMHFFLAAGLRPPRAGDAEAHQDEDEDIETRDVSLEELRAMIARGEIVDLKTIGGVALVPARLTGGPPS
jgi:ADP-ribose pyrophosphatase